MNCSDSAPVPSQDCDAFDRASKQVVIVQRSERRKMENPRKVNSKARHIGDAETRKAQKKSLTKEKAIASSSHEDVSFVVEAFEDINEPPAFEGVDMSFARLCLMDYVAGPEVTANALESLSIVSLHSFHWVIVVVYF